jgi:hypothetical protein
LLHPENRDGNYAAQESASLNLSRSSWFIEGGHQILSTKYFEEEEGEE